MVYRIPIEPEHIRTTRPNAPGPESASACGIRPFRATGAASSAIVDSATCRPFYFFTETKTVYVDYSGSLQKAQIDNVQD